MNKAAKITIGSLVALLGVAMIIFGIYETFKASWEWLILAVFGFGVTLSGYALARGTRVKELFEMLRDTFGV